MQQLAPFVDHAAQQSDRWLFIAMLVISLLAFFLAIRYLVRRGEKSDDAHAQHVAQLVGELSSSREHHSNRMEVLTKEAFLMVKEMSTVVAGNTAESKEVRKCLERLGQKLPVPRSNDL